MQLLIAFGLLRFLCVEVQASELKPWIRLKGIEERSIEVPLAGGETERIGRNFEALLIQSLFESNQVNILSDQSEMSELALRKADPCIFEDESFPGAEVKLNINEMSLQTGSRADRKYFGFNPMYENRFNDNRTNLIDQTLMSFGRAFDDRDFLHSGKEIGKDFDLDLFLLGVKFQSAAFHFALGMEVFFKPIDQGMIQKNIRVHTKGRWIDVGVQVRLLTQQIKAGILFAQRQTFQKAFQELSHAVAESILEEARRLPVFARLQSCHNRWYVNVGENAGLKVGHRFYNKDQWENGKQPEIYEIEKVFLRSALLKQKFIRSEKGALLKTLAKGERVPVAAAHSFSSALSNPQVATENKKVVFEKHLNVHALEKPSGNIVERFFQNTLAAFFENLRRVVTLPYRLYRFFKYDEEYKYEGKQKAVDLRLALKRTLVRRAQRSWTHRQLGLDQVWMNCKECLGSPRIKVAILDSGIDYNHPELRHQIWMDPVRKSPGWDFISWDSRPYDDHSHGTEVAGMIAGQAQKLLPLAPYTQLMPVRVIDPFGQSHSAALYEAFRYAIFKGAQILVLPWSIKTRMPGLEQGLKLAQEKKVLVIAAAGDDGIDVSEVSKYPASYARDFSNLLIVTGYDPSGKIFRNLFFSGNWGPSLVHLAAPVGRELLTAAPRKRYAKPGHSGLAAGLLAGSAAMLWGMCPQAKAEGVREAILWGAQHLDSLEGKIEQNRALYLPTSVAWMRHHCDLF